MSEVYSGPRILPGSRASDPAGAESRADDVYVDDVLAHQLTESGGVVVRPDPKADEESELALLKWKLFNLKSAVLADNQNRPQFGIGYDAVTSAASIPIVAFGSPLPIGLSVMIAESGVGKSRAINQLASEIALQKKGKTHLWNFGEPLSLSPYSLDDLAKVIGRFVLTSRSDLTHNAPERNVLFIDSLMGLWSDPFVNKGFGFGARGASWGVPVLLSNIQSACEKNGASIVVTLNPSLATLSDVSNSLAGSVAGFYDLSSKTGIVRTTITPLPTNWASRGGLPYRRDVVDLLNLDHIVNSSSSQSPYDATRNFMQYEEVD